MTWDFATTTRWFSNGRVVAWIASGCALAACSPSDVQESAGNDKQPIVWLDQIESEEDVLDPSAANDQRREVFEEQDEFVHGDPRLPTYHWLRSLAQESTVALVEVENLTERQSFDQGLLKFPEAITHQQKKNLCPGQRYGNQSAASFCSGTLIDDDLVLTAAHCVFSPAAPEPEEVRVVFNHYNIATDAPADIECDTAPGQVCESDDVFRMRLVLVGDRGTDTDEDWAIVQLVDANGVPRSATPRYRPAPVRLDASTSPLGTTLAKLGAPSGVPIKISLTKEVQGKAGIVSIKPRIYQAFLDTFGGDSGGGIYDTERLDLIALESGSANFVINGGGTAFVPRLPDGQCNVTGVCPMSQARRTELQAAGVTVSCQDASGQAIPDTLVRVDAALANLCDIPVDIPPIFKRVGITSDRLCGQTTIDTCEGAEAFDLKLNHEITLSGDTSFLTAASASSPSCAQTGGAPTAFYRFEVPTEQPVMFYADSFSGGTSFDTVLFLTKDCPATSEIICDDDSEDCPSEGGFPFRRSRFATPLSAGTYFLGVTGFGGATGPYTVHVQSLALSDNGILLAQADLGGPLFIDDNTNNSASSRTESSCGMPGAKDFQVLYATCPDYAGGALFATTCDSLTPFDTVLSFEQGSRPFTACHDDILVAGCFRQSSLGFTDFVRANSGSGIRSLYVDGFSPADSGSFGLSLTLPP